MTVEILSNVGPSKIEVAYERFGDAGAPPALLIMGLGTQMLGWHEGFCQALVEHGLQVIRFDNRDVGLSSHLHQAPSPDFPAALAGDFTSVSYRLSDMAADTVGLMDALGLESAHFVGASMGGMIAQTIAIEHPHRLRSLTSIMSTTGDKSVGQLRPEAWAIFSGPSPSNREEVMEQALRSFRVVGSLGFPFDEDEIRARAGLAYDRAYDPLGLIRQSIAVIASGDRTAQLSKLSAPTLVIHGAGDLMCDVSGGEATARAIPGAELAILEGMGHSLPRALWPRLASLISGLVQRAEAK